MATTDLTNTTWVVPAGWRATAGYGHFNITGKVTGIAFNGRENTDKELSDYEIDAIKIGYAADSIGYEYSNSNCITVTPPYSRYYFKSTESFTLTITGGNGVNNEELIAWLETYGELQIPVPTEDTVYIKYNNETINSITKGQTCTLQCKSPEGKATQMLSDIDVEFVVGSGGDEPTPVGSPLRKITLTTSRTFTGTINVYTSAGTGLLDVDFKGDFTLSIPMERLELVAASGYVITSLSNVDCNISLNSNNTIMEVTNIALAQEGNAELSFGYVSSGTD